MAKALRYVLALVKTVAGGAAIEGDAIVVSAGPRVRGQLRCPICGRRCECHDHEPTRRRGAMDLARSMCFPGYGPARAACPEHGVRAGRVPWARPGHARDLGDWVACLAAGCRVSAHPRIARAGWRGVGGICGRACDGTGAQRGVGRLEGPGRIGIDETSHEKGHKYLTVVVDHDRGCLVWAHEGYGREVLGLFLDELAREQRRAMEVAAADGAKWTEALAGRRCPNARWVMDPFHVVEWTSDALDEAGREEWRVAKGAAQDAMPRRDGPGGPRGGEETPPEARAPGEAATRWRGARGASRGRGGRGSPSPGGRAGASSRPGTPRGTRGPSSAPGRPSRPRPCPATGRAGPPAARSGPWSPSRGGRGAGARTSLPPWRRAPESAAWRAPTTRSR